ncbi:MAG: peptidoglycan-binding protein [Hyphomonadaceae bacterium]|nr:peptidoglycan-binding protein [Clostridia bacterium]
MATIYVFNPITNLMETFNRGLDEPMPYNVGNTLSVREFRANSRTPVVWTDRRTMQSWNTFRAQYGRSIYVGFAFKRIWEGGHTGQSQHYAGNAFDMGQNLTSAGRAAMREVADSSGVWSYVEPANLTPTWVHVDRRFGVPACAAGGFPTLSVGSRGVYVLVLQDALNALGYTGAGLDGYFGNGTRLAVVSFQRAQGLGADGVVGCATWERLTSLANGVGLTSTVVRP